MINGWPHVKLSELLSPVQRDENVRHDLHYDILGAHWYAKGLYIKESKPGSSVRAAKVYRVEQGDFVYNRLFAWKGSFAIASTDNAGCYVSNEFPCFEISKGRVCGQFLWRYFSRQSAWTEALGLSSGSTPTSRNRLKEDKLLAMEIPLPPLVEQRRIVARIDALAAKIDEAHMLRGRAQEAAAVAWKVGAAQLFHAIDRKWSRPLNSVITVEGGGTPSKANPAYWNGSIPWVSPKDMKEREISDSIDHITQAGLDESSSRLYQPGAVLIVIRGMILVHTFPVAVLRAPATINQDMKALISSNLILPEYLSCALWGLNDEILKLVDRSSHDTRKLVTSKLQAFEIPVPPEKEQRRIVAYLDSLQAKVDAVKKLQEQSAAELDALLPSILDGAFKGEL